MYNFFIFINKKTSGLLERLFSKRIIYINEESIQHWGTTVTTPFISKELAKVKIRTKVSGKDLHLLTHILDENGDTVVSGRAKDIYGEEFE